MADFLDNFTGASVSLPSHTADTGQAWATVGGGVYDAGTSGTGSIFSGSGLAFAIDLSAWAPAAADYKAQFTAKRFSAVGEIGVLVRTATTGAGIANLSGYMLRWYETGAAYQIYKIVSGVFTQLGTDFSGTCADGDVILLDVAGSGTTTLTLKKNGTTLGTRTDSSSPITAAGLLGVWLNGANSTSTGWHIDQLQAGVLVSTPTTYTLTGPGAGVSGAASSNFTVTLNSPAITTVVVTPSDGGAGGTVVGNAGATVSIPTGSSAGTFIYTAASTGAKTISATNGSSLTNPASLTYTAYSLAIAPSSQSVANSVAASMTATLTGGSGTLAATATGGTLSTAAPTSGTAFTLTTQSSGSGTDTVTVTHAASGAIATATVTYSAAAATAFVLTGPAATPVLAASAAYTVLANGAITGTLTVTPVSTVGGDTFTPTTVTISSGSPTATFTITASTAGARTVTTTGTLTTSNGVVTTAAVVFFALQTVNGYTAPVAAVGYTLKGSTGAIYQSRTTAGVVNMGNGIYAADVTLPDAFAGVIVWDDTAAFTGVSIDYR